MPDRKVKIIVNPSAGQGRAWKTAHQLHDVVSKYTLADWVGTVYPGHATELARQAGEEGFDLVIAVGGDGTVHEVVNGLMKTPKDRRPALGVVPYGTGNDFAYAVGMDPRPEIAVDQIFSGAPFPVDIGLLEDDTGKREYWDNAVGIGFDTIVTLRTRNFRFLKGFFVFFAAVIQTILLDNVAPLFTVRSDREEYRKAFLLFVISNGPREGGGFLVSPPAKPDDGTFHYAAIVNVSRLRMFRLLPEVIKGAHERFPDVTIGSFEREIELSSDRPMYIHADGEIMAGFDRQVRWLKVHLLPKELMVCCSPKKRV